MSSSRSSSSGNADSSVEFHGMAMKSKGGKLEPYSYHPRPLGARDIEIKITHCGVCASDVHTATGGWGECMYPCIVGHEIVGEVVKCGAEARKHRPGDRVGVGPHVLSCLKRDGSCEFCTHGETNLCPDQVLTYNSKYKDGEQSQGGYAESIRVHEEFAVSIPSSIPSDAAAPLLCAGVTTYAPLKRFGVKEGKRVGIIGIGGLGHLAIQFAHAMGAHVVAISSSKKKEADAKELGANEHIDFHKDEEFEKVKGKLDVVICTANAKGMDYDKYISLCAPKGVFVLVGMPEEALKIQGAGLVMKQITMAGSIIGSMEEEKEMLEFAEKHGIKAKVQTMKMKEANEAWKKMNEGDVHFRIVLEN